MASHGRSGARRLVAVAALATGLVGVAAVPAGAAFPGENGPVVFSSLRDGNRNIYLSAGDSGSPAQRLTSAAADDMQPAMSADGSKIAFTSYRTSSGSGGTAQIWVMNIDGSGQHNLTAGTSDSGQPAWSPDGSKIVYVSSADGGFQLYVMNSDGSDQHRIFAQPSAFDDSQPVWSPDGTRIAFVSVRERRSQIFVMNADGTGIVQVSDGTATDVSPNWSPDGSTLAFATNQSGSAQIYTMPVAPAAPRTRITFDDNSNVQPTYSPDGSRIAFVSHLDSTAVVTMELSSGGGAVPLTDGSSSNDEPDWGPEIDGTQVPEMPRPAIALTAAAIVGSGALLASRRSRRTLPTT